MFTASIAGNIGADAETRHAGQATVTSWRVAVEQRGKDGKVTTWVGCSLWGKRGDALQPYLRKGGKVAVSGELTTRVHDGKTYLEINVSEVTLLGGTTGEGAATSATSATQGDTRASGGTFDDSEIPF